MRARACGRERATATRHSNAQDAAEPVTPEFACSAFDALAAGSFSISALLRHLGVGEPAERMVVLETVRTLAQRGLVRVVGRTGRSDLTGAVVELVKEGARNLSAGEEGFYWVSLGQNPPEIAYWERGEWWLAGDPKPWQPDAVTVLSDRLVFRPRLAPVA